MEKEKDIENLKMTTQKVFWISQKGTKGDCEFICLSNKSYKPETSTQMWKWETNSIVLGKESS